MRDKKELRKETRFYLARELKNMAELKEEYKDFDIVATPLIREIWFMSACCLEDDI